MPSNKPVTMPTPQELIAAYVIVDSTLTTLEGRVIDIATSGPTNDEQHANVKIARQIIRGLQRLFANERQRLAALVPASTQMKES